MAQILIPEIRTLISQKKKFRPATLNVPEYYHIC